LSSDETGIEDPDQMNAPARRTPGRRVRAVLAAVLIPLLVLGVVASGYLAFRLQHPTEEPLNPVSGASGLPSDHDRAQAIATAEQFALRMDDVDGTKFDAYVKRIEQLLTTKAKAKNKEVFTTMGKTYAAAKIKGTGKILLAGVAALDSDSSTVLVAHDASVTTTQGSLVHHYRWDVELVKVHGTWLVDDFNPVN
jgi:Mce-associated membrane protein